MLRRIRHIALLLLAALTVHGQSLIGNYEFWLDADYGSRTTSSITSESIEQSIDIGNLTQGVHYLNFRASDNEGIGPMYRYIFFVPGTELTESDMTQYEYWLDADYANRVSTTATGTEAVQTIDVSHLSQGIHYLNFRAFSKSEGIGPMYRYIFFVPGKELMESDMTQYEYWLDADYANRVSTTATGTEALQTIDVSHLSQGIHYLNFRAFSESEGIGPMYRYIFFVPGKELTESDMTQYEYWLDADYANRVSTTATGTEAMQTIDVSHLSQGIHYLNFRAFSDSEGIGPMYRYIFFVPEKEDGIEQLERIEYWLDDAEDSLLTTAVDSVEVKIVMDISHLQTDTTHYFNIRGINKDGQQSLLERFEFFYPNDSLPMPTIVRNDDDMIAITMPLDSVSIYYTTDGSEPTIESTLYIEPFRPTKNCIIKAIALLENFRPSEVATFEVDWFKVKPVVFAQDGRKLSLTTPTDSASIYYKIGNGELDILYIDTLTLDSTCTIRATAKREGYIDADVTSIIFNADSVTVATPVIVNNGRMVGISTTTENAVIRYTLDGTTPTVQSPLYTDSITVERNCTVRAIAMRKNWFDSEVATKDIDIFKVPSVSFAQDGRVIKLNNPMPEAIIWYRLSTSESQEGIQYKDSLLLSADCTVFAWATRDGYNDADVTSFDFNAKSVTVAAPVFTYDSHTVTIRTSTPEAVIRYTIDQPFLMDSSAVYVDPIIVWRNCTIKAIATRKNWFDSEIDSLLVDWIVIGDASFDGLVATVSGERTLDEAFDSIGGRSEAAKTIAAIVWSADAPLMQNDLQGLDNPNLLIFVDNDSKAASVERDNIVINGQAKIIRLTDAKAGNNNFYCPQTFTAEIISYTRDFEQETQVGVSRGWESIALPFDVETIIHEDKGSIAPFGNDSSRKHFWLRQLGGNGLTQASRIEANTPYIICMPNSSEYTEDFNLNGKVTFSAQNATVPVTEVKTMAYADSSILMKPTMQQIDRSSEVWALNVGQTRGQYFEGSVFERDYREVRPFEAYTVHISNGPAPRFVPIKDIGGITSIETPTSSISENVGIVYDLNGRRLQGQPKKKGVYFMNGKKLVIK